MLTKTFKVFSLCNEIHLDKVAMHFGINKTYKWEDFLYLGPNQLKGIIKEPNDKMANIFPFGSIVFINMEHHEIVDLVNYLKKIEKNLVNTTYEFSDDYILEVKDGISVYNYESMSVSEYEDYQVEILSIVLSKSVALEKIEADIEKLLVEIEKIISMLERSVFKIRDEKLAKVSARLLGFRYNTLYYIMLLDKPDITWNNQAYEEFYNNLAHVFELNERYEKIQTKTESLMDITQVFTSLTHQKRGNKLEWMVVILILIEIMLTLVEYIFLK